MKEETPSRLLKVMRECADAIPKSLAEKVDPKHTAIIVVDMQNDFCHEEGISAKRGMETRLFRDVAPPLAGFLAQARQFHPLVVFVRTLYTEWSISPVAMQQQMRFPGHLRCFPRENTWGADFYGLAPQEGEAIVTKYRYSSFQGTDLEAILRSRGTSTIIVTGVATPICVETTVRDGYLRELFVVVPRDCVAARSIEEHNASLNIMGRFFAEVVSSADIIQAWQGRT